MYVLVNLLVGFYVRKIKSKTIKKKLTIDCFLPLKIISKSIIPTVFKCIELLFFPVNYRFISIFFVKINTYFQAATAQFLLWLYLCVRSSKKAIQRNYTERKNLYSTAAIYNHFSIIPIVRYTSTFIFRRICGI